MRFCSVFDGNLCPTVPQDYPKLSRPAFEKVVHAQTAITLTHVLVKEKGTQVISRGYLSSCHVSVKSKKAGLIVGDLSRVEATCPGIRYMLAGNVKVVAYEIVVRTRTSFWAEEVLQRSVSSGNRLCTGTWLCLASSGWMGLGLPRCRLEFCFVWVTK